MRGLLIGLLLVLATTGLPQAQTSDDATQILQLSQITSVAIKDVRARVRPTLSPTEQQVLDQVEFNVDPTVTFQGLATKSPASGRKITISIGVAFMSNVMGQSMAVGYKGNVPCMQAHLFRAIKDAVEDMASTSSSPRTVLGIAAFSRIEPACRGGDALIADDPQMKQAIGATTRIGLSLVILHEIAHQLLNHLDTKISFPPTQEELELSRQHEDAADRWAIAKAIEIGEPFALATPYLLFMTAIGMNSITLERESTHPSGVRRALVILDDVEQDLPTSLRTPDIIDSVSRTRMLLQQQLPQ